MASTRDRAQARALMAATTGMTYTQALRQVQATHRPSPQHSSTTWLAGVYEPNALGEVFLSFELLARGTTRFRSREHVCDTLAISIDGDTWDSNDPELIARARRVLAREQRINTTHRPGQLRLFVCHAPHLDGAALLTFALDDEHRTIPDMIGALTPAANASHARERLVGQIEAVRREPTHAPDEVFLADLGIAPEPPDPQAERPIAALHTLTDDFRGFWDTYVANTHIGVLHTDCWS